MDLFQNIKINLDLMDYFHKMELFQFNTTFV
ncbi:hypothetical protein HD_1539 [[Haemophilus] ducreyi 35000HP]|uniref:Uncharacterized protein n=1 Tax=Haemophilus ducreyi (strain 35000HP / ATCC 700724) TaxID=233412 RepID=Q7VLC3_HAEDU|nr:hypothetical protein HD_1539 [[Haemophilus] ducreyi 35000HP]